MTFEEIIEQILKANPNLSKEEVQKMINEKRREVGRYFTDEVIARIVASDLGVETTLNKVKLKILIRDLISGLSDVTIIGRVIAVIPPKNFENSRATFTRKLARVIIGDKTGTLTVILWNDKAEKVKSIKQNQIVKISHGYLREAREGTLELHVGERGEIEVLEEGAVSKEDYPNIDFFLTKIGSVTRKHRKVHVKGMVINILPVTIFERSDKTVGKLLRLELRDETGEISVLIWNEKVEEVSQLKQGDSLQIMNARVKQGLDKKLELHVENLSQLTLLSEEATEPSITELKAPMNHVTITGIVASKPFFREITTAKGEKVALTNFELKDATGKIWVSAWKELADFTKKLSVGDKIQIKNGYVKRGFADNLEISTRSQTSIKIISKKE